jgi:hypothetical protein
VPGGARALLRRARGLLEEGEFGPCLAVLEEYALSSDYDLGPYEELVRLVDRLSAASPEAAPRLRRLFAVPPVVELPELVPGREEAPQEAMPYDYNARYRMAAPLLRSQPERCLRTWALVASRAPRLVRNLSADLFRLTRSNQLLGRKETLRPIAAKLRGATWIDRLARGALEAQVVEREGGAPTTPELDQVLSEYPGATFARVLRVVVLVRAGRTLAAREDLAVLREIFPDEPLLVALATALLLAKEGAEAGAVLKALRAAKAKGFRVGEYWRDEDYPEFAPYLEDPQIRSLLTTRKQRRVRRRNR